MDNQQQLIGNQFVQIYR